ncbi:ATP-dependent nuclease [Neorhizobium galegae]|uniref:ATP-dependent nuclease n=1 Tax=Neorhizobium galegae TaxID=399 RepID=UPI002103FBB2|nr:ATP-dependent endonuclease [Neorhizobium galegae]MCQ1833356.1 ATP-dependent endonuclease [Neorhizobium galegae]
MYLASLTISNFRRFTKTTVSFQRGLNVIVGPNNIGKSAVVDGLRALLAGADDPYPRFTSDDIHLPKGGTATGEITFTFVFKDLDLDDEADFLHALRESLSGDIEAVMGVTYGEPDKSGRLRARRWCGQFEDVPASSPMLDNLRSVYLQPLRDAEQNLRPGRNSQLSRLLHLLSGKEAREEIGDLLKDLDKDIKNVQALKDAQDAIFGRHQTMLGAQLAQVLNVELAGNDFGKLAARLSILVDAFELDRNGLGYNNLIYMAVVLSELSKNADASYRSLIVEEPEAHLHPQLQAVLLRYLSGIQSAAGEKAVQVFVTSHSPNFASIADLNAISCLYEAEGKVEAFHLGSVQFEKGKREKLKRYLDVTRAELFFARRVIFVEGAAELLMVSVLAMKEKLDLRDHGVSLISVEGLNFDSFMPLFGQEGIQIPVSVITDADPSITSAEGKSVAHYPGAKDLIVVSANTKSMKEREDEFVKVFHGQKTFEYDLALDATNRTTMLSALADIHPGIAQTVKAAVDLESGDAAQAKALFRGMFERHQNNVQKGRFAQALAASIQESGLPITVPGYIRDAVVHACQS